MNPINRVKLTDHVKIIPKKLPSIPEGDSVFAHDTVRSGVDLPNGWMVMYEHHLDALQELVLYNHNTGDRILLDFQPAKPELVQFLLIPNDLQTTWPNGLVFLPSYNPIGKGAWEWRQVDGQAAHYGHDKVFVRADDNLLVRGDVLLHDTMGVIDWVIDSKPAGSDPDVHTAHVSGVLKRYRRLAGVDQPVIHHDSGDVVKVTEVKIGQKD